MKSILQQIQARQITTFSTIKDFGLDKLATKQRGLYWIWTSLKNEELQRAKYTDNLKSKHVNIQKMVERRDNLEHLCNITHNDFRIIYNGIGGYRSDSKASGLRERILQEFTATSHTTGTLSIVSSCLEQSKFAVSFFNFDDEGNKDVFELLNEKDAYYKYASELEKLWRLEFGHPILCRM